MKNNILTGGLMLIILTFFLACNPKKEETTIDIEVPTIDKELVKSEIQAIEDHFALTYNNRNADSITYYAENAVSYFAGLDPIVGKAAIHQHIKDELFDFPEGAKISFKTLEIYVTDDGDHVAEIGEHVQIDSTGNVLQRGHYMSFFEKRDGKYVCFRDMANSVQITD